MDYNFGLGGKYLLGNAAYISLDLYMDNYEYNKLYTVAQLDKKDTTFRVGDEELTKRQKYYNGNLKSVFRVGEYNKLTVGTEYANDYMKNPAVLTSRKRFILLPSTLKMKSACGITCRYYRDSVTSTTRCSKTASPRKSHSCTRSVRSTSEPPMLPVQNSQHTGIIL